jgi:hypothetical protein
MKRYLIACAALLLSASALADECDNATTQLELNTCSAQQYQAADKSSTRPIRRPSSARQPNSEIAEKSAAGVDCPARRRLRVSRFGPEGGSVQPMLVNQCMTEKPWSAKRFSPRCCSAKMAIKLPAPPAN